MSMYQVNLYHCLFSTIPQYSMHPMNMPQYKTVYFSKMVCGCVREQKNMIEQATMQKPSKGVT